MAKDKKAEAQTEEKPQKPVWKTVEQFKTPELPEPLLEISVAQAAVTALELPARKSMIKWYAQAVNQASTPGARSEYRMVRAAGDVGILIQFREILPEPEEVEELTA